MLPASIGLAMEVGALAAVGVVVTTLTVIPIAVMAVGARGLLRRGFTLGDLTSAFDHEIEQLREEYHAGGRVDRPRLQRAAGITAVAGSAMLVAGIARPYPFLGLNWVGPAFALVGGVAALGGALVRAVITGRRRRIARPRWRSGWRRTSCSRRSRRRRDARNGHLPTYAIGWALGKFYAEPVARLLQCVRKAGDPVTSH